MLVRRKTIGGQVCYEIAEMFRRGETVEYRSIVPLGADPDPQEALRKHRAALLDFTKALIRLQPLRGADPAIRRKCDNLKSRLRSEQNRIGLLMNAIERLDGESAEEGEDGEGVEPGPDDPSG